MERNGKETRKGKGKFSNSLCLQIPFPGSLPRIDECCRVLQKSCFQVKIWARKDSNFTWEEPSCWASVSSLTTIIYFSESKMVAFYILFRDFRSVRERACSGSISGWLAPKVLSRKFLYKYIFIDVGINNHIDLCMIYIFLILGIKIV